MKLSIFTKSLFLMTALFMMVIVLLMSGCEKRDTESTWDLPDESNLREWHTMLDVRIAEPGEKLETNDTRPSNVSPEVALTKALKALNSYRGKFKFPLNTAYTIKRMYDDVVNGHYYYVGPCEYDRNKPNGSTITMLDGIATCAAVVDAEDETAPAVIRIVNAKGEPYRIKIHMETLLKAGLDSYHVFEWLDNNGIDNRAGSGAYDVTRPIFRFDDDWNPMYSVTWVKDLARGEMGTAFIPVAYVDIDTQKATKTVYALDNPITKKVNEGENPEKEDWLKQSQIPKSVEWVYSRRLFIQMATHWGYPVDNRGKKTVINQLILDGSSVNSNAEVEKYNDVITDISMSRDRKDLIMVGYMTSRSNDMSMNGILTFNLRTGKAVYHETSEEEAQPVKSHVMELIKEANILRGYYDAEDFTQHTIFGQRTWEGILTRNIHDNENNNTSFGKKDGEFGEGDGDDVYFDPDFSYSTYASTCWVAADLATSPADVICDSNYDLSLIKYRNHLYRKDARRGISTVLKDTPGEGKVTFVSRLNENIIFEVSTKPGMTFVAEVMSPYDSVLGDATKLQVGQYISFRYGNQMNSKTAPVRLLKIRK